jgi:hypothetical protein
MITNVEALSKHISNQLRDYAKRNAIKCAVIVFDDFRAPSSMLAAQLCSAAGLNTKCFAPFVKHLTCMASMPRVSTDLKTEEAFSTSLNYADAYNGLLIGSLSRNDRLSRTYGKWKEGRADLFPIYDLYLSEINQLLQFNGLGDFCHEMTSIDEVTEYLDAQHPDIILADEMPNKNKMWFRYTMQQKEAIAKLHAREKKTRHKQIDLSRYLALRKLPWFK